MLKCARCGQQNPEGFRFCGYCTAPLIEAAPQPREVRKTVSVLFTDVTGSTAMGERLDPESLRRVMARYFDEMLRAVERHEGTVEKFIGDAVMAVFGVPALHEDDALRAVRAAVDMRDALSELNVELERDHGVRIVTRTGVNTGEVVAGDPSAGQRLVTGDTVNTAARLEQAAPAGDILIGDPTWRLVRDAVRAVPVQDLALKGKAETVPAYRLLGLVEGSPLGSARRLDSAFVGRDRELRLLSEAFDRTASDRACYLFTVLGAAGIGKSRLVGEFLHQLGPAAKTLMGRCLPYGEGITYWPVAEVLRDAAGIVETEPLDVSMEKVGALVAGRQDSAAITSKVAELLGLSDDPPGAGEEVSWAVRRVLECLTTERPLVVVLDDIHWAEPNLLDLVEHVADWTRDTPILLACVGRPELLDARPGWAGGKFNATSMLLEPLHDAQCEQLIENLLGGATLAQEARRRILDAAEGNPLFLEQTLAMLIDDGLLVREEDRWVPNGDLSTITVPPTIQALLAARLDQLVLNERAVMERASVVGKVFYRGAVRELSPEGERPTVGQHLMTLVRKELIRPDADALGEDAFRFRNLLIRDAAYAGLPKEVRAELHERFAEWLEQTLGDRATAYEEIIGYHLEQAFRYRTELGPSDDQTILIGRRAAEHLHAAGRAALGRVDFRAALNLMSRAIAALPRGADLWIDLQIDAAESRWAVGDVDGCLTGLTEALSAAEAMADERRASLAELVRSTFDQVLSPEGWTSRAPDLLDRVLPILERNHDDRALAIAWRLKADIPVAFGRISEADVPLRRALDHARAAGDRLLVSMLLLYDTLNVVTGPTPVAEAIVRCESALDELRDRLSPTARLTRFMAFLAAMNGDLNRAAELIDRAQAIIDEVGLKTWNQAETWQFGGHVAMLAGDPSLAAERYSRAFDYVSAKGDKGFGATLAAEAARAHLLMGDAGTADRLTEWSRDNGASDDIMNELAWRGVRARSLAMHGMKEEVTALGHEVAAMGDATDLLVYHADARMDLAEACRLVGDVPDAGRHAAAALGLYDRKGNAVGTRAARAFLAREVS